MGVARGEIAVCKGMARVFLDRAEQFRHRLVEPPVDEICRANPHERRAHARARAEAQRGLDMLDRNIGLTGPNPEEPLTYQPRAKLGLSASARSTSAIIAPISSPKYARQRRRCQDVGSSPPLQGPPGKIDALLAVCCRILGSGCHSTSR